MGSREKTKWYVKVTGNFSRETFYTTRYGELALGCLKKDRKWASDYPAQAFTQEEREYYGIQDLEKVEANDD